MPAFRFIHDLAGWLRARRSDVLLICLIMVAALAIALWHVETTGPLWPDSPRYTNAAAMIHDWLGSGHWARPKEFALQNYGQYPGFSMPYHPPAYPALLGSLYCFTGVSYLASRVFVAVCFAGSGAFMYVLLRQLSAPRLAALGGALVMVTTPELARWSRDTMSEIPGLFFLLAATVCFLKWKKYDRALWCWLAFLLAAVAFLSRVTTALVIPAWIGYLLLSGMPRRCLHRHFIAAACGYLLISVAYFRVASTYGRYEASADGRAEGFGWRNVQYFVELFQDVNWWGTTWQALGAVAIVMVLRKWNEASSFFLAWLACFSLLKLSLATSFEVRHFFYAFPALAGLACAYFSPMTLGRWRPWGVAVVVAAIAWNASHLRQLPHGFTGHAEVARALAAQTETGNILVACWCDQELIFRFRAENQNSPRQLIRSDRTISVRLPEYAQQPVAPVASSKEGVLEIIRRGRARFLVTCSPFSTTTDDRPLDFRLADETARGNPELFQLLETRPVQRQYHGAAACANVFIWRYLGELPQGESDLPILIPTSNLKYRLGDRPKAWLDRDD